MKKIILYFFFVFCTFSMVYAQSGNLSPKGSFDKVFDRFGNTYNLKDLKIVKQNTKPQKGDVLQENVIAPAYLLCTPGYFNVYFEEGSGFEKNTPSNIARRDVICQAFTDISNFITPADPSVKVNIWVRNIANIDPYPLGSGILGLASSFYVVPTVDPPVGGILDGQIWKTINSGVDAYTNVASPLTTGGGTSGAFYHGMVAFNFTDSPDIWHTDLTAATASMKYDLYSTILHEVTHALGFASLISANGESVFGSNYPYYSRYDQNLETFGSAPLIITNSSCSLYEYEFNPSIFDPEGTLAPNPLMNPIAPDHTDCLLALQYAGSVNQAVYTPNYFDQGSSLSHLEDECYDPTPYPNNQYYCMSNATGTGSVFLKRYLKPEERSVLCDIGYVVGTTYGNMLYADNYINYGGSACTGLDVAGVNDGMNGAGSYSWVTTASGTVNLTGSDLLTNDYNADAFECLEVINGLGSVTLSSGSAATMFDFNAGPDAGIALMRYIPVNTGTGNRGDITYLYVYISNGTCVASPCNMIMNSGFENGSNCGEYNLPDAAIIDCWEPLIETPDYFVRGCTPLINGDVTVPTGPSITTPATDTWNSGLGASNDAFLGLEYLGGPQIEEAEQTILSNPMTAGISYTLSFWAKSANAGAGGYSGENKVSFRGTLGLLGTIPSGSFTTTGDLLNEANVADDGEWHYYTLEFIAHNTMDNLMVANLGNTSGNDSYVLIDDLTLTPTAHTALFKTPRGLCAGKRRLADLSQYIFPAMQPGATFSGNGVVFNGTIYSFIAPANGLYTIFYNYTTPQGCSVSIPAQINVTSALNPSVSITIPPYIKPLLPLCEGVPIPLVASGAKTYAWNQYFDNSTANIFCSDTCDTIYVAPPASGYWFGVLGIDSLGCSDTSKIWVPSIGCGGGGGNPPVVRTFEMPDDVKHYTTKIVPGTRNYSVLAGTIFKGGTNNIHFLLLDHNGSIIISKEYISGYPDERVVDIQPYTDKYKVTRWYIVCQSNSAIKVLCVDNVGNLIDQREYIDNLGHAVYPMSAAVWDDGANDLRLFICGYQTSAGGASYSSTKQAFLSSIDINWGGTHMDAHPSSAYDWGRNSLDFDIATRMAVIKDGPYANHLWITGSKNGVVPTSSPSTPDRSAVMNIVVDPMGGGVVLENSFIWTSKGQDDNSGPSDYGIDLIQVDAGNFILGNSVEFDVNNPLTWGDMIPHPHKIWWIQAVDDVFAPTGDRRLYSTVEKHWASQAIPTGGNTVTIATLSEAHYSTCIPLPETPSPDNIQVSMVPVDLSSGGAVALNPVHVYMTSTGTGFAGSFNSFYDLGNPQSLMEYPPKFADLGNTNYAINAPKFMNGKLNLKVMTPDASLNIPCGQFDCNNFFIDIENDGSYSGMPDASDIVVNFAPSLSNEFVYTVPGGGSCHDMAGNPSYSHRDPNTQEVIPTKTRLYPNPATNKITLELAEEVAKDAKVRVVLQNVLGQEVSLLYSGITVRKLALKLPELAQGVYVVQVLANDDVVLKEKLIIEK